MAFVSKIALALCLAGNLGVAATDSNLRGLSEQVGEVEAESFASADKDLVDEVKKELTNDKGERASSGVHLCSVPSVSTCIKSCDGLAMGTGCTIVDDLYENYMSKTKNGATSNSAIDTVKKESVCPILERSALLTCMITSTSEECKSIKTTAAQFGLPTMPCI